MGRHSKAIEPTAQGAPLGRFLRELHAASGMTWRELGNASHMSHTTLSQGADGHLASRWETVEQWLQAFYRGVNVERAAGWGLEEALAHARALWLYCQECARLQKPPVDDVTGSSVAIPADGYVGSSPSPGGQQIVMEIREVRKQVSWSTPTSNGPKRTALAAVAGANQRAVSLENLHEARSAAEFLTAIEDARVAAGLAWADLVSALFERTHLEDRAALKAG